MSNADRKMCGICRSSLVKRATLLKAAMHSTLRSSPKSTTAPRLARDPRASARPRTMEPTSSTSAATPAPPGPASATRCGPCATRGCASPSTASIPSRSKWQPCRGRTGAERQQQQCRPAADWGCEVVAVPDVPGTLEGLDDTVDHSHAAACRSASTRSWSRSASASPRRWAATWRCAAAIPTRK